MVRMVPAPLTSIDPPSSTMRVPTEHRANLRGGCSFGHQTTNLFVVTRVGIFRPGIKAKLEG